MKTATHKFLLWDLHSPQLVIPAKEVVKKSIVSAMYSEHPRFFLESNGDQLKNKPNGRPLFHNLFRRDDKIGYTSEGFWNCRLLPCLLAWEKVPDRADEGSFFAGQRALIRPLLARLQRKLASVATFSHPPDGRRR